MLFQNHTDAMRLYQYVKNKGIGIKISPTPRAASLCCGVSLLVEADAIDQVKQCIDESHAAYETIVCLPRQYDEHRYTVV